MAVAFSNEKPFLTGRLVVALSRSPWIWAPRPTIDGQREYPLRKRGADVDPKTSNPRKRRNLVVNRNYGSRFDAGLILLGFIVVCTAYVLAKLY